LAKTGDYFCQSEKVAVLEVRISNDLERIILDFGESVDFVSRQF
jgi:hypothetical protein